MNLVRLKRLQARGRPGRRDRSPAVGDGARAAQPNGSASDQAPTARSRSGLLHVLIAEDRYDHRFVESSRTGSRSSPPTSQRFTPDRVEAITGVPAETVRELARAVAAGAGCSI